MQSDIKKKVLYIMGVDWNWIYQRPQIIAEYLSRDYDVTVAYPVKIWERHTAENNEKNNIKIKRLKLWSFPFQEKIGLIERAADVYNRRRLKNYQRYDYIYLSYPVYIRYIPEDYKGCLIYDCIDDHEQMCGRERTQKKVREAEQQLIRRSQVLLASSERLLRKISKGLRHKEVILIRNGTGYTKIGDVKKTCKREKYDIGYIGTIAGWIDYKLLEKSVRKYSQIIYHLIGPRVSVEKTDCERILYEGIVKHSELQTFIRGYDCLIMPFMVNEIIESVDPVKLYEYIAFGKCIISVYYEELKHFSDYVYFYTTQQEFDELLFYLIQKGFPPKYNEEQQQKFLLENNWNERYKCVRDAIRKVSYKSEGI